MLSKRSVAPPLPAATRRLLVVAHLHPKKRGSLEQQFVGVATRLGAAGVSTHFVFARPPAGPVAAAIAGAHASWSTVDYAHPIAAAATVARLVRQLRPDVVHLHFFRVTSPIVQAASASGAAVVVNDHMLLSDGARGPRRWAKSLLARVGGARVARRVAVSALVARAVQSVEGVPERNVRVIENGVDLGRFGALDRSSARTAFGVSSDGGPVIACVARMAHEKGVDVALQAFARVAARRPATLLIAGDGPLAAECKQLAQGLGIAPRVRFLGLRDDVERVLAAADQAWVPSRNEAFGLAAAEAMAAGLPVVATRAGALDEVVLDRQTGLLVDSERFDQMAEAALALLCDGERAANLGRAGRARAERCFSMGAFLDRTVALYDELCPTWFHS